MDSLKEALNTSPDGRHRTHADEKACRRVGGERGDLNAEHLHGDPEKCYMRAKEMEAAQSVQSTASDAPRFDLRP